MTQFVSDGATQNYWELELGVVTLGAPRRVLVPSRELMQLVTTTAAAVGKTKPATTTT